MPRPFRTPGALALSVFVMCGGNAALQADPAAIADLPLSHARLIAAEAPRDGIWTLAVAITLKGHAHTYWRNPGDAGVPPTFDFAASKNVAGAEVAYPVPKRIGEAGLDAIGYEGQVVFPLHVTLRDPGAPATLAVQVDYATCERICLPARAHLSLGLPPARGDVDTAAIHDAQARVPRKLDAGQTRDIATITRDATADAAGWRVRPTSPATDLFAEASDGFFMSATRDGDAFRLAVVEHPAGKSVPDWVRVTLARPEDSVEFLLPAP